MLALVQSGQFANQEELADAMGVSTGKLSNIKARLIAAGRITQSTFTQTLVTVREAGQEPKFETFPNSDF